MTLTSCISTVRPQSAGISLLPACAVWGRSRPSALRQRHLWQPSRQCRSLVDKRVLPPRAAAGDGDLLEEQQQLSPQTELFEREPYLEVGSIITTHGVRGEVKVQALTDFPEERLLTAGTR